MKKLIVVVLIVVAMVIAFNASNHGNFSMLADCGCNIQNGFNVAKSLLGK